MSQTAAIKITDEQGNLIGKIRQIRRQGRRLWEALGKNYEGRYVLLTYTDTRTEAQDAIRFQWKFGW